MKILNLGFDVDGVTLDTLKLKAKVIKEKFGVSVPSWQCRRKIIIPNGILTVKQYSKVQDEVFSFGRGFLVEPMSESLFYIVKLIKEGHQILEITSRRKESTKVAQRWFFNKGINIKVIGVGVETGGNGSKVEVATGLDLYVDDDLYKLLPMIGIVDHLFLFNHRHNENDSEPSKIKRVNSWEDIYEKIQEIRKG